MALLNTYFSPVNRRISYHKWSRTSLVSCAFNEKNPDCNFKDGQYRNFVIVRNYIFHNCRILSCLNSDFFGSSIIKLVIEVLYILPLLSLTLSKLFIPSPTSAVLSPSATSTTPSGLSRRPRRTSRNTLPLLPCWRCTKSH